jgi:hypothetical protein
MPYKEYDMTPQEQAAAILNHYMEQLARRAGLRWTDKNRQDIERAAQLLSEEAAEEEDTIPPYEPEPRQLETRVTQVLEHSPTEDDPDFQRWRWKRYSDTKQARRMLRREGR